MFRVEINVQTGERKEIPLTAQEIADAQARKAAEDVAQAARKAAEDAAIARKARMDAFVDALEADPNLLARLKAVR